MLTQKVALIDDKIHTQKTYVNRKDREPGLVAFYDIWPVNAAGLFYQPWSLHRAKNPVK